MDVREGASHDGHDRVSESLTIFNEYFTMFCSSPKFYKSPLRHSLCSSTGDHWCEHPDEYPEELVSRIIERLKERREVEQG